MNKNSWAYCNKVRVQNYQPITLWTRGFCCNSGRDMNSSTDKEPELSRSSFLNLNNKRSFNLWTLWSIVHRCKHAFRNQVGEGWRGQIQDFFWNLFYLPLPPLPRLKYVFASSQIENFHPGGRPGQNNSCQTLSMKNMNKNEF